MVEYEAVWQSTKDDQITKIEMALNKVWLDGKSHCGWSWEGDYEVISLNNAGISKLKQKELCKNNKVFFFNFNWTKNMRNT